MSFGVRDEVKLKFGGPTMVVENIEGDLISTFWFHRGLLRRERFLAGNLTRADQFRSRLATERAGEPAGVNVLAG